MIRIFILHLCNYLEQIIITVFFSYVFKSIDYIIKINNEKFNFLVNYVDGEIIMVKPDWEN